MMVVSLHTFFCQLDKNDSSVFFAAMTLYISFVHQTVHGSRKGSYGNIKLSGNRRHIIPVAKSDCLDHMHIIICKIFELIRNDCLFFQFPYFIDQTDQCLIDHLICVIHSHLL